MNAALVVNVALGILMVPSLSKLIEKSMVIM